MLPVRGSDARDQGARTRPGVDFRRQSASRLAGGGVVARASGWVTSVVNSPHLRDPLPVALANPERFWLGRRDCEWTSAAMTALEKSGLRYRVAYTSASQLGTHAPVVAGLAVTVSTLSWLPEGLRPLGADEGCRIAGFRNPHAEARH